MVCKNPWCLMLLVSAMLLACASVTMMLLLSKSADTSAAHRPAVSRATDTLQLVFIVSRHGNRCPVEPFPNYPFPVNDTNIWPYGKGQLTRRGLQQLQRLGVTVRTLYDGFLSSQYTPEVLSAVSSPITRTLMSAEAFLSGLYPPAGPQVWDPTLPWQPIPVYPSQMLSNEMIFNPELCPTFTADMNKQMSLLVQKHEATMNNISKYVQPYTGGSLADFDPQKFLYFWDSLKMAERESLPLPGWTGKVYPEPLDSIASEICAQVVTRTDSSIRLFGGPVFKEIIEAMHAKVNGSLSPDRRMYYFSGHDVTIALLQAILGLPPVCPETGSGFVLELHRDLLTLNHFVQIVNIDGKLSNLTPTPLDLPQCPRPCSIDTLMKITNKYYNITDYYKECHV